MPRNPNLVATSVTDKNGRMTTVYRRPYGAPRITGTLPTPRVTHPITTASMALNAVQRLTDCGVFRGGEPQDKAFNNLRALAKVSPAVLEEVVSHIENAEKSEQVVWYWKLSVENLDPDEFYVGRDVDLEGGEYYLREIAVAGLAARITKDIKGTPPSTAAGTSISDAEYLMYGNFGEHYSNLKAAVIVLGVKSLWLSENEEASPRSGREMEDSLYVADNLDAVERVLDELIKRRTTDPEVIEQLIGTHCALTDGNL